MVIFAYIAVLFGVNFGLILSRGTLEGVSPLFASPFAKDAIAFLTFVLPVGLYFALQESSPRRATWGKRKTGLQVGNANSETLNKTQAFVRVLVKFLPWQIAHTSIYHIEGFPYGPV